MSRALFEVLVWTCSHPRTIEAFIDLNALSYFTSRFRVSQNGLHLPDPYRVGANLSQEKYFKVLNSSFYWRKSDKHISVKTMLASHKK